MTKKIKTIKKVEQINTGIKIKYNTFTEEKLTMKMSGMLTIHMNHII